MPTKLERDVLTAKRAWLEGTGTEAEYHRLSNELHRSRQKDKPVSVLRLATEEERAKGWGRVR